LISMVLKIAFKGWNIWVPQVLTSLCRRPRQISTFYTLLKEMHIIFYTDRHE